MSTGIVIQSLFIIIYFFKEGTFLGVCGTDVTINELANFVYQPYVCFLISLLFL